MKEYIISVVVFVLAILVLQFFKSRVIAHLKHLSTKTKHDIDDLLVTIIDNIGWPLYFIISLYIAFQFIDTLTVLEKTVAYLTLIVVTYYVVIGLQRLIEYGIKQLIEKRKQEEEEVDTSIIHFSGKLLKAIVWVVAIIIVLQNLGYNVSTLIAGLGIGGLAIGLALQSILGDLFGSFSIYFDKPFQVGDFIVIGDDKGVVKKIGIKSTRLRTLDGDELVISNKELTDYRIRNFKKMKKRRIVFQIGVTYDTTTEKLKKIPKMVKKIIEKEKLAETDRIHFKEFADFSLIFEIVYFVKTREYAKYMDTQQRINLAIKEQFDKEKIEMAFPTQTIYVNHSN